MNVSNTTGKSKEQKTGWSNGVLREFMELRMLGKRGPETSRIGMLGELFEKDKLHM